MVTVCFDALGTCFTLEPIIEALERQLGDALREHGASARGVALDWRDYTYLSITAPPPPPIARVLTHTLARAVHLAAPALDVPDLSGVTENLTSLSAAPTLAPALRRLKEAHAHVLVITNGSAEATQGYIQAAGISELVDAVQSCDEVGLAKPFRKVYEAAHEQCALAEAGEGGERWFVAAHTWDLAAARQAGFRTALVADEVVGDGSDEFWALYGGRPEVAAADLAGAVDGILGADQGRRA